MLRAERHAGHHLDAAGEHQVLDARRRPGRPRAWSPAGSSRTGCRRSSPAPPSGRPCASHAVRAMLNDCSPTCETQPPIDLADRRRDRPRRARRRPAAPRRADRRDAGPRARLCGGRCGLRTASTMKTSGIGEPPGKTAQPTAWVQSAHGALRAPSPSAAAPETLPRRRPVARAEPRRVPRREAARLLRPRAAHLVGDATRTRDDRRGARARARRRRRAAPPRASVPATSSRSSCRTGSRRRSRSTARACSARCWCRSCTSTARRRCASSSSSSAREGARDRGGASGSTDYLAGARRASARAPRARARGRRRGERARRGTMPFEELCDAEPLAAPPRGRPRRAGGDRLHLGHDRRSRRASIHSHRPIVAETRQLAAMQAGARPPDARRRAGRPRHRHARRASWSRSCQRRADPPDRRLGPERRARRHARGRPRLRAAARPTSSRACSTPGLRARAPRAHAAASGSAVRRCRPRSRERAEALGHLDRARATARPSTRRSRARSTTSRATKRKYTDGRPLAGVELRLVDDDGHDVAGRASRARS